MAHSPAPQSRQAYWRRTQQLTWRLLLVWFLATLLTIVFARELSTVSVFGWPVSFYMAAQGCSLIYLLIVGLYAARMRRLEQALSSGGSHAE